MKIIHIITQMEAGGAQGAAVRNSRYFQSKGIDSEVIFLYKKRDVYRGDDIISLADSAPRSLFDFIVILFKLFKIIRSTDNAKIICYTHYANVIGSVVGYAAGVRNIVVSHRNPVETYPRACRIIDRLIGLTPIYGKCICVSKTVVESFDCYPKQYKNKIRLVYNGVDTSKYQQIDELNKFSWLRETARGRKILISTGRLHPQKNQIVLLKAMLTVDDCCLVIAGEGELRLEFEQFIQEHSLSDKVHLIGEIPPDEVRMFLAIGDVFLFPSNYEAFGFSVVEAMASGLPVICSDIPAMKEIVGEAGILLDKDQEISWSSAINSLSKASLFKMRENSIQRAKKFSLEEMANNYLEIVNHAD